MKLLIDRKLLKQVPCSLDKVRFAIFSQKREELVIVLLLLRNHLLRMKIRVV